MMDQQLLLRGNGMMTVQLIVAIHVFFYCLIRQLQQLPVHLVAQVIQQPLKLFRKMEQLLIHLQLMKQLRGLFLLRQ